MKKLLIIFLAFMLLAPLVAAAEMVFDGDYFTGYVKVGKAGGTNPGSIQETETFCLDIDITLGTEATIPLLLGEESEYYYCTEEYASFGVLTACPCKAVGPPLPPIPPGALNTWIVSILSIEPGSVPFGKTYSPSVRIRNKTGENAEGYLTLRVIDSETNQEIGDRFTLRDSSGNPIAILVPAGEFKDISESTVSELTEGMVTDLTFTVTAASGFDPAGLEARGRNYLLEAILAADASDDEVFTVEKPEEEALAIPETSLLLVALVGLTVLVILIRQEKTKK